MNNTFNPYEQPSCTVIEVQTQQLIAASTIFTPTATPPVFPDELGW